MNRTGKSNKVSKIKGEIIDIAKYVADDADDDVVKILQYLDEVAQQGKAEAPILKLRPEPLNAG